MENSNYIRPWPYTRYKARGGLISDIRPWPYMRGNTVGEGGSVIADNWVCEPS